MAETTLAKKPGTAAQLYRNLATWDSPDWDNLRIEDLHFIDKPANLFDTSDRKIKVNTKQPTGRSEWSIEFDFIWDSSDDALKAIVDAAQNGTSIELLVTDDDVAVSGTKGLHAEWAVESGWDVDAKLQDGESCKVKLTPYGNYTNPPTRWLTP